MRLLIQIAMMCVMTVTVTFADEAPPPKNISAEQTVGAARLRTQDQMFALLMATYYEVQSDQIDRDYERRLNISASESRDDMGLVLYSPLMKAEKQLPNVYRTLVVKERELRMSRMAKNMTDLLDLYQSSRLGDQKEIGMSIPSAVDMETATKQVKRFLAGRLDRPRDPRLWAERNTGLIQAAAPEQRKDKPLWKRRCNA
jgi:hypothetical protein